MDAQEELAFLRSVAASQLQTIKALTLGCEKYGLTETTPVVRHLAAQDDEIERLRAELELHKGALIAEQEHVETLEAELAECRAILEKIADPVHAMQRELPEGARLNGAMAVALSNDPNYLKGLAKAGLFDAARKGEETE